MFGNLLGGFLGSTGRAGGIAGAAPSPSFSSSITGAPTGFIGSSFGAILNSVNTNAQQGISPFGNNNARNLSPQQIAAQMQQGGAASVVPLLGGRFLPKILFPIAGLWSMVTGIKALVGLRNEAAAGRQRFDPSQLQYHQMSRGINEVYANPMFSATQRQRELYGDARGDAGLNAASTSGFGGF